MCQPYQLWKLFTICLKKICLQIFHNIQEPSFTLIPLKHVNIVLAKVLKFILEGPFLFKILSISTTLPSNSSPQPAHLHLAKFAGEFSSAWADSRCKSGLRLKRIDVKGTVLTACCKITSLDTGQKQTTIYYIYI